MATLNVCRWLTQQRTRRYYGWNFAKQLKDPAVREELRHWSLRENELAVAEWAVTWLVAGAIVFLPLAWVILQWVPSMFTAFVVVVVIGPLSGVLCLLEIYGRWLIGRFFPESRAALPGGACLFEGQSLMVSSVATYVLIPVLFIVIDRLLLTG